MLNHTTLRLFSRSKNLQGSVPSVQLSSSLLLCPVLHSLQLNWPDQPVVKIYMLVLFVTSFTLCYSLNVICLTPALPALSAAAAHELSDEQLASVTGMVGRAGGNQSGALHLLTGASHASGAKEWYCYPKGVLQVSGSA